MLIVVRWILARLLHVRFFSLTGLNAAIGMLLEDLNNRPMCRLGKSRRQLFEQTERAALAPLPGVPFEYAEWNPPRCIQIITSRSTRPSTRYRTG